MAQNKETCIFWFILERNAPIYVAPMDFVFLVPFLPPVCSLSLNACSVLHVRFPLSPSSRPSTLVLLPTSRLSRSLLPRVSPSIPFSSTHPFPSCSVPCIPSHLSYPLPFRPLQLPSPFVPFPSTPFPSPPVPFPSLFLSISSFPPTSRLFSRPPLPHFFLSLPVPSRSFLPLFLIPSFSLPTCTFSYPSLFIVNTHPAPSSPIPLSRTLLSRTLHLCLVSSPTVPSRLLLHSRFLPPAPSSSPPPLSFLFLFQLPLILLINSLPVPSSTVPSPTHPSFSSAPIPPLPSRSSTFSRPSRPIPSTHVMFPPLPSLPSPYSSPLP